MVRGPPGPAPCLEGVEQGRRELQRTPPSCPLQPFDFV